MTILMDEMISLKKERKIVIGAGTVQMCLDRTGKEFWQVAFRLGRFLW